ncbi:MAG TPA: NUDIX domain-containing protein [Humisphaera sp.]
MDDPFDINAAARADLARYLELFPQEANRLAPLGTLLAEGRGDVWSRRHPPGHLTGSAVIVDPHAPGGPAVLLVHHNRLNRWLQPGGHLEAGENPLQASAREAAEEVGLPGLVAHPWHAEHASPIDIDIHAIPGSAKRNEPDHFHHDFRYLFVVDGRTLTFTLQAEEVANVRWEPFDGPNIPSGLDLALAKTRRILGLA